VQADPLSQSLATRLAERRWDARPGPAFVMVAVLPPRGLPPQGAPHGLEVQVTDEPDDAWAAMYHYRGQPALPPVARTVLTSAEQQSFVSIRSAGEVRVIARLSVACGWAGITAVEVNPAYRRQRLGTAITAAACAEARSRGVSQVFLQVEVANDAARSMYERLGFRYSHRYEYRVAPA
jgi:ribosomal protein S18 acetylase RimI-like enzyme